jgi:predicted nuclease of predicted toxin-antitoxin system
VALRFKLDENMPGEAVALLREAGHDVHTVLDQGLGGRPDDDVSRVCRGESRILVTLDLDFGDLRTYPPADHAGIWVLRPAAQSVDAMLNLLRRALVLTANEQVSRRLWVIEPGRLRIKE